MIYTHRRENDRNYDQHKVQYEAILAALKQVDVPERRRASFYIDADRTPSSLRRLKDEEQNAARFGFIKTGRCLDVTWPHDGFLVATFYNKDLGAFGGTFVTIHSPKIPSSTEVNLQGVFKQVAPNWWAGHID